jgi:hypothetical protein
MSNGKKNIHKPRKIVDSDRLKDILESIEVGMSITDACELSGICRETFYNWKRAEPNAERLLRETALKAKKRNIGLINKHATEGDWKAAAWWLERKYQEEFSLRYPREKDNKEVLEKLDLVLKAMKDESKKLSFKGLSPEKLSFKGQSPEQSSEESSKMAEK